MKLLFLLLTLVFSMTSFATEYDLTHPVNDYANVLSESEKNTLSEKLMNEYKKSNTQIAILTVPSLKGQSIEEFSMEMVTKYKLGLKGVDNGVLYIIATGDRKTRIEVGRGLEGSLTDARSKQIQVGARQYLKAQKYFDAFSFITDEIISSIKVDTQVLETNKAETGTVTRKVVTKSQPMSQATKDMILTICSGIAFLIVCIMLIRSLLNKIDLNAKFEKALKNYNTNKSLASKIDGLNAKLNQSKEKESSLGSELTSLNHNVTRNISDNSNLKSEISTHKSRIEKMSDDNSQFKQNPREMFQKVRVETSNDELLTFLLKHTK